MAVQTKKTRRATKQTQAQTIAAAAKRNGIPVWVLMGVKLAETGSGAAANPFQFEPSTASSVGVKNVNSLPESADGAAKLLKQYKEKYGSWDAAFEAYNGGPGAVGGGYAYNKSHITDKLREYGKNELVAEAETGAESKLASFEIPNTPLTPFGGLGLDGDLPGTGDLGNLLNFPDELLQAASATTALFAMLTSVDFWIRVGEAIAALILIYMGLHSLTGQGPTASSVVQTAAGAAAVAK